MGITTLLRYLIGGREAIRQIAASRGGLWVGLLFVLSAAFARDYDGENLWAEPWRLLIPLGASLAAATTLFLLTYGPVWANDPFGSPFLPAYRAFLTLFWMTAPLAWLYAIPYERFLSSVAAVEANLWTLALVAAWRVALIVRVLCVLMGFSVHRAVFIVMAFADGAAFLAVWIVPHPVIDLMGGLHMTASERLIANLSFVVSCFGILSAPVWAIGALVALAVRKAWPPLPAERARPSHGLWALAAVSLAVWAPILPFTQAEQRLRTEVEHEMRDGRIAAALDVMSAHMPNDFPPLWEPPPRLAYGEPSPTLWQVLDAVIDQSPAEWVRTAYVNKLQRFLRNMYAVGGLNAKDAGRLIQVLRKLPEGPALVAEQRRTMQMLMEHWQDLSTEDTADLKALLAEAGEHSPPP